MSSRTREETIIHGLPGSDGIAIGSVLVVDKKKPKVRPTKIKSDAILSNLKRFSKAKELFVQELDELSSNLDHETINILETQKQIIMDMEIEKKVNECIEVELYAVDFAVYRTFNDFIERLRESGSELFRQRIVDLENIRDRLISLSCENQKLPDVERGSILILRDISPTDLVAYHEKGISGLVMDKGGITSHAAIIAQSLDMPCIVSAKTAVKEATLSKKAILDGSSGELILDPSSDKLKEFKRKIREIKKSQKALLAHRQQCETKSGNLFHLRANIEFDTEIEVANNYGAQGIGLLRTEALLYGGIAKKSEVEQSKFYETILAEMEGPVTIRLFDVGGDKLNVHTPDEDNPFLGWRGIRMLLDEREMFKSQLRSILKIAGKYKSRVKILVPMVSVIEEIREVKKFVAEVQKELKNEKIPIDEKLQVGMMIEIPSAALLADHFAKEVDFFSVGTNDLTQYTLAVDRGNERICDLYQHQDPAVWKLIGCSIDAAKKNDIPISVCGELAGDLLGAACLMGMGVNDLSMSPGSIPKVREMLISHTDEELKDISEAVLSCKSATEVRELYKDWP
jgi:phosphotransferase system enzyme I (PtsI)